MELAAEHYFKHNDPILKEFVAKFDEKLLLSYDKKLIKSLRHLAFYYKFVIPLSFGVQKIEDERKNLKS